MSKWIDVKDRLPEDDEDVLICSRNGIMYIAWYFDEEWQTVDSDIYDGDVIAWMPLPEPYKKEVE